MTVTIDDVLSRHGIDATDREFIDAIDRALSAIGAPNGQVLSGPERAFLTEHGGIDAAEAVTRTGANISAERLARTMAAARDQLGALLTSAEAADLLGVDRSVVSRRITGGRMLAVSGQGSHRIPDWQIAGGRLLPHLAEVIAAIPADADPADIAALMRTEQDELSGRTPAAHLAAGGDALPVLGLLDALTAW